MAPDIGWVSLAASVAHAKPGEPHVTQCIAGDCGSLIILLCPRRARFHAKAVFIEPAEKGVGGLATPGERRFGIGYGLVWLYCRATIAVSVVVAQGKHRKAARRSRREVEVLRSETQALRSAVPDSALPALTDGRN